MNGVNDHPRVAVPAPVLFLSALIVALGLHWLLPLAVPWHAEVRVAGMLLLVAGFVCAVSAFSRMVRAGTSPNPHQPDSTLVTNGLFGFTRNPIYLGFTLVFLGFTLLAGTLWGVVIAPLLVLTVTRLVIDPEEKYLVVHFPEAYAEYAGRVRRWL